MTTPPVNFSNGELIVYADNSSYHIKMEDLLTKFEVKQISDFEFELLDEIYIDTVKQPFKLEYTKIKKVFVNDNVKDLKFMSINDDYNFLSSIICFNNKQKKTYISSTNNLDNKFILQNNATLSYNHATFIDELHLNRHLGYLTGYWLLRGGFYKMDGTYYPSWSGREDDIERLKHITKDHTFLIKPFKENLKILLMIEEQFSNFYKNNFSDNNSNSKFLPDWLLIAKQEFVQGLMYGFIASNSYISTDVKNNYYLAIKVTNHTIIHQIKDLLKFRFNIHSRLVGDENHLSFKFNKKLYEFIKLGIDLKYIDIDRFDEIVPIINKEIIHDNFRILPWYKFKKNIHEISIPTIGYGLEVEGSNNFMFFNGVFTNC